MQSRWSESEAAQLGGADSCEGQLALLAYATRLLGAEPDLAMYGGGNTSCKCELANVLGDSRPALFVKASGTDLAVAETRDFVALDLAYLVRLVDVAALPDEAMAAEFACHALRASGRRASVETLLHTVLPHTFVFHTHPSAILALGNRTGGAEVVAATIGDEVAAVPYVPAGLELARAVRETMTRIPAAAGLVLMQHGLVTWGASAREAYEATIALVTLAEVFVARSRTRSLPSAVAIPLAERERKYAALAPVIRSVLGPSDVDALGDRVVLDAELDGDAVRLLDTSQGKQIALSPPLTPDYLVRGRKVPLWLDQPKLDDAKAFREQLEKALADYQADYRAYVAAHSADPGFATRSFPPRAILIPGLGVVAVGRDAADGRMVRDITLQGLRVKAEIWESGADYQSLGDDHLFDMEFRAYQQAKTASDSADPRSLRGSVALVTGAAGAIGSGICEALLERGCHVAVTDLPGPGLDELGQELGQRYPLRAIAVAMDVTDKSSVASGFAKVVRAFGGLDAVVVNAGIAHVAPLIDLDLDAFRKLEAVNVEGTLFVLAEAGRHFAVQNTGGDVVLVSTKNVFAPGAGFGAYSATKAAAHQLARIASLEFAPLSVRVNMVAPDAVFSHGDKRSGLWAAVGPSRMKARGLDERGLEEYYRSRNLLKARVTAEHVAAAVLFFLTHQTPTTGATIPVDGGLPDATPR
jgi:rhamnose utilization protein RhaD (predicted bifunctional aldolase and dehydrogenase)/NAD(P)-dependent dehydrogenase (short-subunit alcohol dehydrogenase family)